MGASYGIMQMREGSLILNRHMGVSVTGEQVMQEQYIFRVHENNQIIEQSQMTSNRVYYFTPMHYGVYTISVDIYNGKNKVHTAQTGILDFVEDFVLIKETALEKKQDELIVHVETALQLPKEYYAYYLKRDGVVVERIYYTRNPSWHFKIKESGEYCVQVFVRLIKNTGIEDKVITHTCKVISS
ncbi:MAG: hypothetical protein ACRCW2_12485 [Cellulosilyticaceae bacterium]